MGYGYSEIDMASIGTTVEAPGPLGSDGNYRRNNPNILIN
jgi:hypothetical protein